MFVDACAIVSLFVSEPDADAYDEALADASEPFTSALAVWEAVLILARPEKLEAPLPDTLGAVMQWLRERKIELRDAQASPAEILSLAISAAVQQGVGKKRLSSFDCFHYAHAKAAGAPILTNDRLLRATDVAVAP